MAPRLHPSQMFPGGAATATAPPPTPMNNAAGSKPRMPPIPMPFGHSSAGIWVGVAVQGKWLQNRMKNNSFPVVSAKHVQ